ncbi:MAG TPA: ABC transporter permease [Chloroflexota bacterium]|nr:ABC transporter permease [Chloroflexota bacterium]
MKTYILRRLGYSLISLAMLSMIIFFIIRLTGDPARLMVGPGGRPEDVERTRVEWGLDRPWPEQYVSFVRNLARGDFGTSFQYRLSVRELYAERLPYSLQLASAGLLISLLIGIPAGIITAVKVDTFWDSLCKVIAMLGLSIPGFFVGLLMIIVFAVNLRWLPASGSGTILHLVMPSLALGWYFAASMLRLTRSSMLEVLDSEYVKLARLKGVPENIVIAKHAFKNALIPVLTLAGINFVVMVNVAVIIETIFAWPGIGRLLFEGIQNRDFPVVQGVVVLAGVMIVTVNLLVDLLYAVIDPRIRYS